MDSAEDRAVMRRLELDRLFKYYQRTRKNIAVETYYCGELEGKPLDDNEPPAFVNIQVSFQPLEVSSNFLDLFRFV